MGGNLNGSLLYPGIVISFNHGDGSGPLDDYQASENYITELVFLSISFCFSKILSIYARQLQTQSIEQLIDKQNTMPTAIASYFSLSRDLDLYPFNISS